MKSPGYLSVQYANSFREFGEIITLPLSRIHLIKRDIANGLTDLTGVIPFVMSQNWEKLPQDIDFLRASEAVSLTFVADPFEARTVQSLVSDWNVVRPFKTQVVVDLHQNWRMERSKALRKYTDRSLSCQNVEVVDSDPAYAKDFWELYKNTIDRHNVTGMQRLSLNIISNHLKIEGAILIVARDEHTMTGAMLSYNHGSTANAHLLFLSKRAHEIGTNYALIYSSLVALEDRGCRFVNLGGSAGIRDDRADGLFQFKSRWSDERRNSLLCGEILNLEAYERLCEVAGSTESDYFPAYRSSGSQF